MSADNVRRSIVGVFLAVAALLSGACETRGGKIPYHDLGPADELKFSVLPQDYRIAPMDTLTIKVFQADNFNGEYSVDLAGHISLPLVGEVEAANLTTEQLDSKLTQLLGQKYFENPDVSVAIKDSSSHVVTVDGAVNQAGRFPVGGNLTLMQAVAMAKGTSADANNRRVAIFRTIDGHRAAAAFDLKAIRRGESQDPVVYAGDVIIVDGSAIKSAYKAVLSAVPLTYVFTRL